ncbi:late competence development ComFB family protein [candidate division TA06 bacterium]|uniref:Late competence development ComFB family protein n=1 Tax=candidate division TA06 bacterium TaxID=2250710 RepID=A0A933IAR4_UNCT6|nr:late competence development ComFB family protein [candidate division TA06 bacterium]
MPKLTNYMERIVKDELSRVMLSRPGICCCRVCQLDVTALALNQLPSQYVVSEGGHIHTMVNMAHDQLKTQVLVAIVNAINSVSTHPRHKQKRGLNILTRR